MDVAEKVASERASAHRSAAPKISCGKTAFFIGICYDWPFARRLSYPQRVSTMHCHFQQDFEKVRWPAAVVLLALVGWGVLGVGTAAGVAGDPAVAARAEPVDLRLERLPLYFVENRGQADERVVFYLQGRETAVYFTPQGVTYSLTGSQPGSLTDAAVTGGSEGSASVEPRAHAVSYGGPAEHAEAVARWAVKLDFVGANAEVRLEGVERTPAAVSYFKGASFEGQTGLPTYSRAPIAICGRA